MNTDLHDTLDEPFDDWDTIEPIAELANRLKEESDNG